MLDKIVKARNEVLLWISPKSPLTQEQHHHMERDTICCVREKDKTLVFIWETVIGAVAKKMINFDY